MTERAGRVLLVVPAVLAVTLLVTLAVLRSVGRVYEIGQVFPPLSGYSVDMAPVAPTEARCYVIRVTADSCAYCQQDQGHYSRLKREARRTGCRVLAVGPRVGDVANRPDSDVVQLQYVDMRLGRSLDPFLTPQTILLDHDGRLRWHRQGSLNDEDVTGAMREIGRLR